MSQSAPSLFLMAAMLLPAPAFGQVQAAPATALDPNEKVCENLTVVGSRLAKKRVCATRAEWEERQRLDRQAVDQAQRLIGGPCQTTPAAKNGGPVTC